MATATPPQKKSSRSKRVNVEVPDMVTEIPPGTLPGQHVQPIMHLRGRMLGKGGFAAVYELQNMGDGVVVAGKVISKESLQKSRARQKLETEISIHQRLKHPHIVRFLRSFEDSTNVYLLLECCTGRTLADLLRSRMRLNEAEVAGLMTQTIDAIQSLHEQRIIHRDLKLSNLFLDREGRIKVGDFGLACQLTHDSERKTTICGTPNYIAPEVLSGKEGHSYEVDVWSLGVVIYTLLVGKPPFETSDVRSTYRRIRSNAYYFPEGVPLSDAATDLIRKILRTEPETRPTLAEMLHHPFFTRFAPPPAGSQPSLLYSKPSPTSGPAEYGHQDPQQQDIKVGGATQDGAAVMHINVWAGGEASSRVRQGNDPRIQPPSSLQIPSAPSSLPQRVAASSSPSALPPTPGSAPRQLLGRQDSGLQQLGDSNIETMSHYTTSPSGMSSLSRVGSAASTASGLSRTSSSTLGDATGRSSSGLRTRYNLSPAGTPTSRLGSSQHSSLFGVPSRTSSGGDGSGSSGPVTPTGWAAQQGSAKLAEWEQQQRLQASRATAGDVSDAADQLRALRVRETGSGVRLKDNPSYAANPVTAKPAEGEMKDEKDPTVTVSVRCDSALLAASLPAQELGINPDRRKLVEQKVATPGARPPRADSLPSGMGAQPEAAAALGVKLSRSLSTSGAAGEAAVASVPVSDMSLDAQRPSIWVTRWVDYSSKYGMGYVLSNGAVGVLFNDATKVLLLPDRSQYIYMEKVRGGSSVGRAVREERTVLMSHEEPPANLKKKATLLWYFEGYLTGPSFKARGDKHPGRVSGECIGPGAGAHDMGAHKGEHGLVYVKKWLKTKHAIIFRMSNKVIQVDFNDGTEIILSSEMQSVTYVNKAQFSGTHWLSKLPQDLELLKRLKYTKDILLQLIGGSSGSTSSHGSGGGGSNSSSGTATPHFS
mmetsp:Transcript_12033/g.33840  ORF Transcript_12033/g.33840 Transcript_12033/m.33840 type:complete len:934 (-) Transcript_12033:498-3299(-)